MYHGYWDTYIESKGCLPESRKGASLNLLGNKLYLFGGMSRQTFGDMKIFDIDSRIWSIVPSQQKKEPDARLYHTMMPYNSKFILFGGGSEYMPNLKMRTSFNDIWLFCTWRHEWERRQPTGMPPKKRMSHVTSILGSMMVIHGGKSTEAKILLDDFQIYDIDSNEWIKVKVTQNGATVISDSKYGNESAFDEEDFLKKQQKIGQRAGHCMTAVFDLYFY